MSSQVLVLKPFQSFKLYLSSHIMLFPALIGFLNGFYFHSFICFLTVLTSVNYWKHPTYGFRRNLDIVMVYTNLLSHTRIVPLDYCNSYNSSIDILYYAVFFYISAVISGRYLGEKEMSSYFHYFFHIIINFSLINLYTDC